MNISEKLKLFVLIVLCYPAIVFAQNNTSSVYSKFGIGDLGNIAYGKGLALGGSGFAWRDASFLNAKNPASLTAIDTLSFLFETGVHGKYTFSSSFDHDQAFWDGNLSHLMFGHRITTRLAGCFGFMPYSNIGYQMRTTSSTNVQNSIKLTEWLGSGGITKVFYSAGYRLNRYLSLGAEGSFLYGPIDETRRTYFMVSEMINDQLVSVIANDQYTYYEGLSRYYGFVGKAGLQLSIPLDKKGTSLNLGGAISPQSTLWGKTDVSIKQSYPDLSSLDSVYSMVDKRAEPIILPMMYGGGLALTLKGKYLLAADYETNLWSVNSDKQYRDQMIFSVGVEKLPQTSLRFIDRCAFRAGFRYDNGYISVKKRDIADMRLSLGFGMPMQKSRSMMNVTLEAGQRGTRSLGLVREQYLQLTFAFSFHDYWFIKRRFD